MKNENSDDQKLSDNIDQTDKQQNDGELESIKSENKTIGNEEVPISNDEKEQHEEMGKEEEMRSNNEEESKDKAKEGNEPINSEVQDNEQEKDNEEDGRNDNEQSEAVSVIHNNIQYENNPENSNKPEYANNQQQMYQGENMHQRDMSYNSHQHESPNQRQRYMQQNNMQQNAMYAGNNMQQCNMHPGVMNQGNNMQQNSMQQGHMQPGSLHPSAMNQGNIQPGSMQHNHMQQGNMHRPPHHNEYRNHKMPQQRDHFDQLNGYSHPRYGPPMHHNKHNLFAHDRPPMDPRLTRDQYQMEQKMNNPSQAQYHQMMQAQYDMQMRNQYYGQEPPFYPVPPPGYQNPHPMHFNGQNGPYNQSSHSFTAGQGDINANRYNEMHENPNNARFNNPHSPHMSDPNMRKHLPSESMQPGMEHCSRTNKGINTGDNSFTTHENQMEQNSEQPPRYGREQLMESQARAMEEKRMSMIQMLDPKNLTTPDQFTIHEEAKPKEKEKRKKSRDSSDNEEESSPDESTEYDTSSDGYNEVQPKKRGRPRKSMQPTPFQRPQMPYNPNIQSSLGNQYVPNYAPMNYKPTHPFNPVNPKIHNYQTKQTMRSVMGSNASSYQHIFNHPVYRHFNIPQQNGYPPNMYMPPPQPPVRQNGPQYNPYTTFNYGRPPAIGRPKAVSQRKEALSSPIIKKKRKSAATIPTIQQDIEEEPSQVTEEEQDPVEKLLKEREDGYFFVKFRHKSYLHCDWVHKDEISQTKGGLIKVKRYRKKDDTFDPDFIRIDKIIHSDYEDVEIEDVPEQDESKDSPSMQQSPRRTTIVRKKIYLVKWKKLPHELATFEYEDKIKELDGFDTELERYEKRKIIRQKMYSLDWRPSREHFIRFNTSPAYKNNNNLRAYQLEGLNWLLNRWFYKQGCIMADEMGLGKTVQSVTFVNTLFTKYECGPVLIVAPLSTIPHWEREFEAWTDLRTTTYHGSIQGREIIYNYEMVHDNKYLFDVLITTYEMVMSGLKHLENIRFSVGIFDEAHRLKNNNSKAVIALKNIYFNHKVLLSGTPLQNNVQELWSLLNFIDNVRFNSLQFFLEEYKLERSEDVERLQNLLKPIMLRRMKDDVEKSIPVKEETIIEVELTMIQKRFYRALLEKNLEFLTRGGNAPNLINVMIELRKCCIHPYLVRGAEDQIINEYKERKRDLQSIENSELESAILTDTHATGNFEDDNESEHEIVEKVVPSAHVGNFFGLGYEEYYKVLLQSSGKLVLLDKLLAKLKGSHKVLVFSQMTKCLDLLAEYLTFRKHKFERIDGGVRGDQRQAAIDRFSKPENDVFVFLLCTRAGGVGINLTAADTVVIFDSDWNPQNDLQAQARCHRIGQKNEVKVYRLVTRNTYEREMFDKAGMKLGLDRAVLQKMSFEGDKKAKKKDAIETLLKKGAYGVLMETDDIAQKFCEEDIDSILERRTKIVKHMDSGNVFSKATFQVEEEMDDPDFWDNLLNKKKTEEDEGKIKRQVRRLSRGVKINYAKIDQAIRDLEKEVEQIQWPVEENIDEKKVDIEAEKKNDIEGEKKIDTENGAIEKASTVEGEEVKASNTETKVEDVVDTKTVDTATTTTSTIDEQQLKNYRKLALLIFLTALRKGTHAVNTIKNSKDTNKILARTIKYCIERIDNKQRPDFSLHMDIYLKEKFDSRLYEDMPFYQEYYEIFVLRIQIVHILAVLLKRGDANNVEKVKGYSSEDDRRIINWVLTYGYDNFPSSTGSEKGAFKGKKSDDLNGRVRKLIIALNKPIEQTEEKEELSKMCLLVFGKICDDNRKGVEKWHRERDGGDFKTFEKEVNAQAREILSCKKKRGISDVSLHERILMFDRLRQLEEVPTMRKTQGIPRRWNNENDVELREMILTDGITDAVCDKMGMSIDSVVKRVEAMIEKKD